MNNLNRKSKIKYNFERSNKQIKPIVVATAIFVFGTIVTVSLDSPHLVNAQQQNMTKKGMFNYTQTDSLNNPDWINTGNWSLTESPTVVLVFDAVINMVKPDGSEAHEHKITDLIIPYAPINQTNSTVIQGTTTITTRESLVTDVPTTIILSEKDISVYFDPIKIDNHFGNQSITGLVT